MVACKECSSATRAVGRPRLIGCPGWVINREDGAVEAVFEGEPSAVQAMIVWARSGPAQAYVTKLEIIDEEPRGERGFSVR